MNPAINYAITNDSVKTVIFSMSGGYINQKRSITGGFMDIHYVDEKPEESKDIIFKESMRKTLKLLIDAQKNIIFTTSIPRLNFNPQSCVNSRPLQLTNKALKSPCAVSRAAFDEDQREYRDIAFSVLKEFPQVKVFDAAAELCDREYCYAMKNSKMLYRDNVHLSQQGSEYIAQKLVKAINLE